MTHNNIKIILPHNNQDNNQNKADNNNSNNYKYRSKGTKNNRSTNSFHVVNNVAKAASSCKQESVLNKKPITSSLTSVLSTTLNNNNNINTVKQDEKKSPKMLVMKNKTFSLLRPQTTLQEKDDHSKISLSKKGRNSSNIRFPLLSHTSKMDDNNKMSLIKQSQRISFNERQEAMHRQRCEIYAINKVMKAAFEREFNEFMITKKTHKDE